MDPVLGRVSFLQTGDDKCGSFPGSILCTSQDISVLENNRDASLLHWRRPLESFFEDPHEELPLEEIILEVLATGRRHIGGLPYTFIGATKWGGGGGK